MIISFGDKATEDLFHNRRALRYPPEISRSAVQQLDMLNSSQDLRDLRSPPGNRLERLKGDLEGFHSIRINNRRRIIFQWSAAGLRKVRIIDYHRG